MREAAFAALVFAFGAWAVLDGFDLGVGMLHRVLARDDAQRRTLLRAIGPYWDGNEVWLLAAAGVMFIAFPHALGAGFSGLYLGVFVGIWALMGRGLSIELRSHLESPLWRAFFDATFQLSSGLVALCFGVALGNVLRGVPLDATGFFALPLFAGDGEPMGMFDGYTLLVGLFVCVALAAHGCAFVVWKTEGDLHARARKGMLGLFPAAAALWLATTALSRGALLDAFVRRPVAWLAVVAAAAGLGAVALGLQRKNDRLPFVGSCVFLCAVLAAAAACHYPNLLPSSVDPAFSLTVAAARPSHIAMSAVWWLPGMAIVIASFLFVLRTFRGKVEP